MVMMYNRDLVVPPSGCKSNIPMMQSLDALEGYLYYNSTLYSFVPDETGLHAALIAAVPMSDLRAAALLAISSQSVMTLIMQAAWAKML